MFNVAWCSTNGWKWWEQLQLVSPSERTSLGPAFSPPCRPYTALPPALEL